MRVDLHPAFRVHIHLEDIFNIDLASRGYYQIRLIPKPSDDFTSIDITAAAPSAAVSAENYVLPGAVLDDYGVSKTVELTYIDESIAIDDDFTVKVQLAPHMVFDRIYTLTVYLELWFMERSRPPRIELFEKFDRIALEISLNPSRLTAVCRPLFFGFTFTAAVTVAVYASLFSIMPRRRKAPPDPPLSPRLREYHDAMSTAILGAITSLERFIKSNADSVSSPIEIDYPSDLSMASLCSRLEISERPWATLEASAVQLSNRLDILFTQLIHLFAASRETSERHRSYFHEWRQRYMGEAFFFTENPLSSLQHSTCSHYNSFHSLVDKSKYIHRLPKCPVYCEKSDLHGELCPVIFEEGYGIQCTSVALQQLAPRIGRDSPLKRDLLSKSLRLLRLKRRKSAEALSTRRISAGKRLSISGLPCDNLSVSTPSIGPSPSHSMAPLSSNTESSSTLFGMDDEEEISRLVDFVKERESVKSKLSSNFEFDGLLYSELAHHSVTPCRFPPPARKDSEPREPKPDTIHVVVLVHGLEGSHDDLTPYRNALRLAAPNAGMQFLKSSSNKSDTWEDFEIMATNLLEEVQEFVTISRQPVTRISFITHSLGGIIVRTALGMPSSEWMHPRLHTLLTINAPHLGLTYLGKKIQWGLQFLQLFKRSRSVDQLSLRDAISFEDSFLFKLSKNKSFSRFKNILLVGSSDDLFVPNHSALLEPSKASGKDASALGATVKAMLSNIYDDILSGDSPRTLIRYSTFHHSVFSSASQRLSGRAAHVAALDDTYFVERFFAMSALRYFL